MVSDSLAHKSEKEPTDVFCITQHSFRFNLQTNLLESMFKRKHDAINYIAFSYLLAYVAH